MSECRDIDKKEDFSFAPLQTHFGIVTNYIYKCLKEAQSLLSLTKNAEGKHTNENDWNNNENHLIFFIILNLIQWKV